MRLVVPLVGLGAVLASACESTAPTPSPCLRPSIHVALAGRLHPSLTEVVSRPIDGSPFAVAASPNGTVYVTRFRANSVVRADLPATTLSAPFEAGPFPSQVRISADGQTAYVSNQGDPHTVTVFALADNQPLGTIAIPDGDILTIGLVGTDLFVLTRDRGVYAINTVTRLVTDSISRDDAGDQLTGVAFHPSAPCMYIASRDSGEVRVVDLLAFEVVRGYRVLGGARLEKLAMSRDGSTLFATESQRGGLVAFDLATETGTITPIGSGAGQNVFDVAVTPDNSQVYVTAVADGNVFIVDQGSRTVIDTLRTGGMPRHIAFNALGDVAIIANEAGWVDFVMSAPPALCTAASLPARVWHPSRVERRLVGLTGTPYAVAVSEADVTYITQLDAGSAVRANLPLMALSAPFAVGPLPSQVRISADGQTAYVSNQTNGTIAFVSVATNQITGTASVYPRIILNFAVSPDGSRLWALDEFSRVYAINVATRAVVDSIDASALGMHLAGLAFHPSNPVLYVAGRDAGTVGTIDLQSRTLVDVDSIAGGRIQNLAVSLDGGTLYATDVLRGMLLTRDLTVPAAPYAGTTVGSGGNQSLFDVAVTRDNTQLYVSGSGAVYVYERAPLTLIDSIVTSGRPRYIGFSSNGTCAVIPNERGWVNFVY
jgi:YVTN family beta-propeller protein